MTRVYIGAKLLGIFIEHLLYAQYQSIPGTQLLPLVPTGIPERAVTSPAFHSPRCPPVVMAQYQVTVDCQTEQAWATEGPKADAVQLTPPSLVCSPKSTQQTVPLLYGHYLVLSFITSCLLL